MRTEDPNEYAERQARNYRTSLRCWWSREFGYISVLDPFTGEVHEVERAHQNTPRWMTWRAMDEKHRLARSRRTSSASPWRGSTGS
jgi:hypothetical protein